ncbi:ferredoxin [Mycobacterium sp. CVI_P3]|uniref:Ferredoxin n=1 Tax=Mycobacterium pinniadriaticum TaxID=2994102 RepID=A0ABT3SNW0_9MYCO|nr:ferredoxin [Mycobacterium pinniadriaticum]MCX2934026.1 ferredoxin [Mycobacterium pinniadriaticum]MCX2940477.1 ferredoxin [Mycobacterium pinniadriaticum]
MTVRPDNRLLDAPMVPVGCRQCGARVEVRKSSWAQTSVQWNAQATAACVQRRTAETLAGHGHEPFLVCSQLRESIEDAVRHGRVPIVDEGAD